MEDYSKYLKENSQKLRQYSTDAEQKLWQHLRQRKIFNVQFNRQKPVQNFIVDFYCAKAKLVIEIDGAQHFDSTHLLQDKIRDEKLQRLGLKVLRFDNRQVLLEIEAVVEVIYYVVNERIKN